MLGVADRRQWATVTGKSSRTDPDINQLKACGGGKGKLAWEEGMYSFIQILQRSQWK